MSYERKRGLYLAIGLAAALFMSLPAAGQNRYMGDLNQDGKFSIHDVQAMVRQALHADGATTDADLDGNSNVDVLDVQNMINTVLGTGGMVQRIVGQINLANNQNLWVAGASSDGHYTYGRVNADTGRFVLRLRTHTSWALMLCRAVQGEGGQWQVRVLATMRLRLGDGTEGETLPLMNLGRHELNLGQLDVVENRLQARETIQRMLARMFGNLNGPDENENGIPDFVEPLLERLRENAPGVPPTIELGGLRDLIRPCVQAWIEEGVEPDLTDENENGIPDFVEPLLVCIRDALTPWLENHGISVPQEDQNQNGVPDFVDALMAHIRSALPQWLSQIGPGELVDENENGIADFVEDRLGRVGTPGPMDSDGDGIPNFAEDNDGDGIPNCEDPDCSCPGDDDCDGVPNDYDWEYNHSLSDELGQ